MEKIQKNLLPFFFVTLLLAVPIISFLHKDKKVDAAENRVLNTLPVFAENDLSTYFDKMSSYLNDHFGWRKDFIKLYSSVKDLFDENAHAKRVVMGQNDFAFYKETIDLYQGKRDQKIIDNFVGGVAELKKKLPHTPIFVLIAPSKAYVYEQHLPTYVKKSDLRDHMIAKFKNIKGVSTLDLLPSLQKETRPTFMRYETHWTGVGAYAAYKATIRFLRRKLGTKLPLKVDITQIKEYEHSGDLARMMGKAGQLKDTNNIVIFETNQAKQVAKEFTVAKESIPDYANPKANLKVLTMHDSYMEAKLGSYLSHSFKKMINIWDHNFEKAYEAALKTKPDLIIIEAVDRHVY